MNKYRSTRDYENLQRAMFEGVGEYGIPILRPDDPDVDNWIGFNYALGCEEPEIHGVHFFVDDYQFVRLWKRPEAYAEKLGEILEAETCPSGLLSLRGDREIGSFGGSIPQSSVSPRLRNSK